MAGLLILGRWEFDLIHAIATFGDRPDVNLPPELLIGLGYGESKLNMQESTGDAGQSVGVFQIHIPAHGPGLPHGWKGLVGTKAAMELMRPRWVNAFRTVWEQEMSRDFDSPFRAWLHRTVEFLYLWWNDAQGSIQPTWAQAIEAAAMGKLIYVFYLKELVKMAQEGVKPAPREIELAGRLELISHLTDAIEELSVTTSPMATVGNTSRAHVERFTKLLDAFGSV